MLNIEAIRAQFPALHRQVAGQPAVFFDGPAGSQVPQSVADAVSHYLLHVNANTHGSFVTAHESDAMLAEASQAGADLVGATDPDEITFGANMTTLTFALSRAMAQTWSKGDQILCTRSEHDANVSPWLLAARDAEVEVQFVPMRDDTTLDLDALDELLSDRTRLVAVGAASNATGTRHPIATITAKAHAHGAQVFVDAVHFAPHALMDVTAWGCDFLACSAYKFFGPHVGLLWGRREFMEALPAYRVRPASNEIPDRWMTGTQNHEGIAGTIAAIDYLASLANTDESLSRRQALALAFEEIKQHETPLLQRLMTGLAELEKITVWGIRDPARLAERLPTVSFTHADHTPLAIAQKLGERGIFVWDGNYYALEVTQSLGLEPDGMVRVGLLHYNTEREVEHLLGALRALG